MQKTNINKGQVFFAPASKYYQYSSWIKQKYLSILMAIIYIYFNKQFYIKHS